MELLLVFGLLLLLLILGSELFVVIGGVSLLLFYLYIDIPMFAVIKVMFDTVNKAAFLAIPLYVFAGVIMAKGEIAKRLIDLATASLGWMKGGLAVASVLACMFFAAISGSSPVTLIAIGSIMYPALIKHKYPENFSIGLLTSSGSLGILIPPSIPMIVFCIVTGTNVDNLFIAGILPGVLTGIILMIMCVYFSFKYKIPTISAKDTSVISLAQSIKRGIPALGLPVLILGGIYTGIYTVTEAASVAAIYALIVEFFIFKEMKFKELIDALYESVIILGIIFIIIVMATVFNFFLTIQDVPAMLTDFMQAMVTSKVLFLVFTIILLLIVGLFMDIISAILIIAPLVFPTALSYGIDPVHLGIIFILGLEIGYLTPPIGINLFVSSALFDKPFMQVVKASIPFVFCMILALLIVTFVPEISLMLVKLTK